VTVVFLTWDVVVFNVCCTMAVSNTKWFFNSAAEIAYSALSHYCVLINVESHSHVFLFFVILHKVHMCYNIVTRWGRT